MVGDDQRMFADKKLHGQEILALLNCRRLPARLSTGEAAVILGFQEHDIAVLISAKFISPLGTPAANAPKYFAAVEIVSLSGDREWLSRATRTIAKYWQQKNERKGATGRGKSNGAGQKPDLTTEGISHRKDSMS